MTLRRPHSVHVFLVRIVDGERSYLLLHRRARTDLDLPAFWQGVSGALDVDEDFPAAARREVEEETGLRPDRFVDTGFQHRYPVRPE